MQVVNGENEKNIFIYIKIYFKNIKYFFQIIFLKKSKIKLRKKNNKRNLK